MKLLAATIPMPNQTLVLLKRRHRKVLFGSAGHPVSMSETLTTLELKSPGPALHRLGGRLAQAGQALKYRFTLAHLGAIAVGVAVRVIVEDVGTWLTGTSGPSPALRFSGGVT